MQTTSSTSSGRPICRAGGERVSVFRGQWLTLPVNKPALEVSNGKKDPLGAALKDQLRGKENVIITVYSNVSEAEPLPGELLFRGEEAMSALEKQALDACYGRVLDLGAGAGGHSLALQARGLDVVALDSSPGAVEVMKMRGVKQAIHADFRTWAPDQPFDTILLMMNGIGVAGTLDGLGDFLTQAKSWLTPNGQLVLDSSDLRPLLEEGAYLPEPEEEDGLFYCEIDYQMKYGSIKGEPFSWIYIDYPGLQTVAGLHGYTCDKLADGRFLDYLARLTPIF